MDHTVDSTLKFLSNNCQSVLIEGYGSVRKPSKTAAGIYEVQTLLRYLSAIFDRHILREDDDSTIHLMQRQRQSVSSTSSRQSSGIPASDTGKVTSSFAFVFVWAFGGHLHERYDKWIIFVLIKCNNSTVYTQTNLLSRWLIDSQRFQVCLFKECVVILCTKVSFLNRQYDNIFIMFNP